MLNNSKSNFNLKYDVFLSYSREDEHWIEILEKNLKKYGLYVWLDKNEVRPGDLFSKVLEDSLENCKAIVITLSKKSVNSAWVKEEYYRALSLANSKKKSIQIIPLLIEDVKIPGFLQSRNWVDFRNEEEYPHNLWKLVWGITGIKPKKIVSNLNSATKPLKIKEAKNIDWGEAPVIENFFGREKELLLLEKWIRKEKCKLVAITGMAGIGKTWITTKLGTGGIGKSNIAAKLLTNISDEFTYIIFRSLLNSPLPHVIFSEILRFISEQNDEDIPQYQDELINRIIYYLKKNRCLIILDNLETVFQQRSNKNLYKKGYEDYGLFIKRIAETDHISCLLLTSREKPREISLLENKMKPIRSLELRGLDHTNAKELFKKLGSFSGTALEWKQLIDFYNGNPLAIELSAKHITEVFFGDISAFIKEKKPVFDNLRELLIWHFERLSFFEKEIMFWLAINREPISYLELKDDIVSKISRDKLSSTLQKLQTSIPLEKKNERFSLQPVLIEFMTTNFIDRIIKEIELYIYIGKKNNNFDDEDDDITKNNVNNIQFPFINSFALIKALAKDYVRKSQIRLILEPVIENFFDIIGKEKEIELLLYNMLCIIRKNTSFYTGYAAGNIINILIKLKINISNFNFSNLTIRQAYLQGLSLCNVNFSYSEISKSVFTETFGAILSIKFSPNNKLLATANNNGEIQIWRSIDCKQLINFRGHSDWIRSIDFCPNSRFIASCSNDQTVRLWDLKSIQCLYVFKNHTNWIRSVRFSPCGDVLASCGDDNTIRLWDIINGKQIIIILGHSRPIWSIDFSPNGKILASAGLDKIIKLWDISTGECLKTLTGHTHWIRKIKFSPDGKLIASGGDDNNVWLWDIEESKCINKLKGHTNRIWSIDYSKNGKVIASGSFDTTIKLWETKTGQCIKTFKGHSNWVRAISISSDNSKLASGGDDQKIILWDINNGRHIRTLIGYNNPSFSVAFNPNGKLIASGHNDHNIRIWDIDSSKCIAEFIGHINQVWSVAFSNDGKYLVSGSNDRTARLWDVKNGNCIQTYIGHLNPIWSLDINSKKNILATGSEDHTVRIWDLNTGECLKILYGHTNRIKSVAFGPNDNTLLASASSDHSIRLWNLINYECKTILKGHKGPVLSIVFDPKGHFLASGSNDSTIRIWNVKTGCCLKIINNINQIWGLSFSYDGNFLACAGNDQIINIWNVKSGKCVKKLQTHQGWIWSLSFCSLNYLLATSCNNGSILIWDSKTSECIKQLNIERPYEKMNITGVSGLTDAQKNTLKSLGAIEEL